MSGRAAVRFGAVVCAIGMLACAAAAAGTATKPAPAEQPILDSSGFWRSYLVFKPPVVRKPGGVEKVALNMKWLERDTPDPPTRWMDRGFDDGGWVRSPLILTVSKYEIDPRSPMIAMECWRGKFRVADPTAGANLSLNISYQGGVIVYLNGKEIARGHVPKAADESAEPLAEDYPAEAAQKPQGRVRKLGPLQVPAAVLNKGVNVLAIEVRRAPYAEKDIAHVKGNPAPTITWGSCSLVGATLSGDGGKGVEPNIARPAGDGTIQVWNSDVHAPDFDLDYGDPNEALGPIRIVAPRNGRGAGKVVVASSRPIAGLAAAPGELRLKGGTAVIPATAVEVRYAQVAGTEYHAARRYVLPPGRFDALLPAAPAEIPLTAKEANDIRRLRPEQIKPVFGAVVPIWVTIHAPADALPGDYEGTLTIRTADARPVVAAMNVKVCPWTAPAPTDFETFMDFIESPDTLAMEYKLDPWSERHWEMIARSLKLLAQAGNKTAYVPLICETNLGNAESMVRWTSKEGGGYACDFTVMDRYLDLVQKYLKPKVVCLAVWDTFLEGGTYNGPDEYMPDDTRKDRKEHEGQGPEVTTVGADGKIGKIMLPLYSDAAAKAAWKPMLEELRLRMKKRGLESAMALGLVSDSRPSKAVVELFKDMLPGVPWVEQAHTRSKDLYGVPIGMEVDVWPPKFPHDPAVPLYGWKQPGVFLHFIRGSMDPYPMTAHRLMAEINIAGSQRGVGRLGGDTWLVLRDNKGQRVERLSGERYPRSYWRNLNIATSFLHYGPDGPVSTERFELACEGVQECEARILIEKALTEPALAARLKPELANRCRKLLEDRTEAMLVGTSCMFLGDHFTSNVANPQWAWCRGPGQAGARWFLSSGWQERTASLYRAAADVAAAVGGR
ncbi:MAG: glycoside hydrolase domain-containing protein [Phycisphaerae bacterium]